MGTTPHCCRRGGGYWRTPAFRVWTATQHAKVEEILSAEPIDLLILGHTLYAKE